MSEDLTKKLPQRDTDRILAVITNLETTIRSSTDSLVTWISGVDSRLRTLEEKVEQRLYDTRPIWHKLVGDISQLQTCQDEMRNDLHQIDERLQNVNERLRRLEITRNRQNSST